MKTYNKKTILIVCSLVLCLIFTARTTYAINVVPITIKGVLTIVDTDPQTGQIIIQCCPPYNDPCLIIWIVFKTDNQTQQPIASFGNYQVEISDYSVVRNEDGSFTVTLTLLH
jgi:hypothetical protein